MDFKNPHDPDNIIITAKIQEWVRLKMGLGMDTMVQVIELNCIDPGCMDKETRIIVTRPDEPGIQYRVHKPIVYVRKLDIDHLQKM